MPLSGSPYYRPRRNGERRRKSIRGCIVGPDLAVLNLVVLKKGDNDIPGLTDAEAPRRLGPKRASRIRKLFVRGAVCQNGSHCSFHLHAVFPNRTCPRKTTCAST